MAEQAPQNVEAFEGDEDQGLDGPLALVAKMNGVFTRSQDIDTMALAGLERICDYVGAEAASLFLLDDEKRSLICRACYGPVDITGLRIPANAGIVGRSVERRMTEMVRDVSADADFGANVDEKTGFTTKSLIVSPLIIGNDCMGAIEIINKTSEDGLFNRADYVLLETLTGAAALAIHNLRLSSQLMQKERQQHELDLAGEIQRGLLPIAGDEKFPIHGLNIPARAVSGDFYDIIPLADGRIWFNIADVSGKGMNASLLMAKTSSLFRCLAKTIHKPGKLLAAVNNELCETHTKGMFVTMAAGLFDPALGKVTLANAGHEPPLHLDESWMEFTEFPASSPPLGIAPDIMGPGGFPEEEIELHGGRLYMFTDGLTEASTFDGGMLGLDQVKQIIFEHCDKPGGELIRDIFDQIEVPGQALRDDLTMIVVEDQKELRKDGAQAREKSDRDYDPDLILRLRVPAEPDRLKMVRHAVKDAASHLGCDEEWVQDLIMAVDEACQNIIRHAYGGTGDGDIVIEAVAENEALSVYLMDFADPVDPESVQGRELDDIRPGGLGVHIIQSVTDEACFLDPPPGVGNLFRLTKRL